MSITIPSHLSDDALLLATRHWAGGERNATAHLVAHLTEIEARGLHPGADTLEPDGGRAHFGELLKALDRTGAPVIFTIPNADSGRSAILRALRAAASRRTDWVVVESLGQQQYFSLMTLVGAMAGFDRQCDHG